MEPSFWAAGSCREKRMAGTARKWPDLYRWRRVAELRP
nr:MAG TPA: hypothetical protein [Caudoviricetes sp.]